MQKKIVQSRLHEHSDPKSSLPG